MEPKPQPPRPLPPAARALRDERPRDEAKREKHAHARVYERHPGFSFCGHMLR